MQVECRENVGEATIHIEQQLGIRTRLLALVGKDGGGKQAQQNLCQSALNTGVGLATHARDPSADQLGPPT